MYFEASSVIADVLEKKGILKNLVFSSKLQNKKALYALSCETLRYLKPLQMLAEKCGVLRDKALRQDWNLAAVLMYEHLLGHGVKGKYKVVMQRYKSSVHSQCERLKLECGTLSIKEAFQKLVPSSCSDIILPKYARINTLLADKDDVMSALQEDFTWLGIYRDIQDQSTFEQLQRSEFYTDDLIPGLLIFHPAVELHSNRLYQTGKIIIQDKASCFPAYILDPPKGSVVIDCCAAPGNKTTHLASIMQNKGTVYAFDKDQKRLGVLQKLVSKAGAHCVSAECKDFLTVNTMDEKYGAVEYILVDPSCSGSGMVNRQFADEESCSKDRLEQLSRFQITILKHALSFPNVKRVVYSTCSVHEEENEMVVEEVYAQFSNRFEVKHLLPSWKLRGLEKYLLGVRCLRMCPEKSYTHGFFVACFERIEENNSVSNTLSSEESSEAIGKHGSKGGPSRKDKGLEISNINGPLEKDSVLNFSNKNEPLRKDKRLKLTNKNGHLRKHKGLKFADRKGPLKKDFQGLYENVKGLHLQRQNIGGLEMSRNKLCCGLRATSDWNVKTFT